MEDDEIKKLVLSINPNENNPTKWDEKELNLFLSKAGIKHSLSAFAKIDGLIFHDDGAKIIKETKGIDIKEMGKLNELVERLKDYVLTYCTSTVKLNKKKKKKNDDSD